MVNILPLKSHTNDFTIIFYNLQAMGCSDMSVNRCWLTAKNEKIDVYIFKNLKDVKDHLKPQVNHHDLSNKTHYT